MSDPSHGPLRTYGRIKSRPIKPRQEALFDTLLPKVAIADGPVDPAALMPGADAVWLEIGFGGGEHLAGQAAGHTGVLFLAAEPFLNGVASALRHLEEQSLSNVRLLQGDARDLAARLPDGVLERVFILFPDPWPKARHHKRRIIQSDFIAELARLLKPGGTLRFATDWADYAEWTRERMAASPLFRAVLDSETPPADHLTTRYEAKNLGDCPPVFLDFVRV